MDNLKLTIELVPESSWNNNIRNLMGKDEWTKLRKIVIENSNHSCWICQNKSSILHCHEIWEYDSQKHIQKLKGLMALCKLCHAIKHIGYSKLQSDRGELNWEKLIQHFMNVNGCNRKTFERHYQNAAKKWLERSRYKWEIYVGEINLSLI